MTYIIYEVQFKKIKDYLHVDNFRILPLFFTLYIHEGGLRRMF